MLHSKPNNIKNELSFYAQRVGHALQTRAKERKRQFT